MRKLTLLWLLAVGSVLSAETTSFDHVKIHRHRSPEKRVLIDKTGVLSFDDTARTLSFSSSAGDRFEIAYDDVTKVVFDVTTHMRGGALSQVVSAAGFPGAVAGTMIAAKHVNDYWLFLEYKTRQDRQSTLLEIPKDSSTQVIDRVNNLFGARAKVADFPEKGASVRKEDLPAHKSKQSIKVDHESHPLPEIKPDQATLVVVCPPLAARFSGKGNQVKLHANDQVVAVNRMGTYSVAYLNPGKYHLVSQAENANGFDMELEAGQQYYFLQNIFQGSFKYETALSRNSPELVMYLLEGSYHAVWKDKNK